MLTVEAPNWLEALRSALEQTGGRQIARGKAICEVKDDGSILVKNSETEDVYYLRTVTDPSDPTSTRRSRQPQALRQTLSYLDAELVRQAREAQSPVQPPNSLAATPVTVNHPCMVMSKEEIDRRLSEYAAADSAAGERGPGEPEPIQDTLGTARKRSERNVQMIRVVDVAIPKKDTLTTLKVDLDALRDASSRGAVPSTDSNPPPAGFEWLSALLESAWQSTTTVHQLGDRTLRLCLAALPCRLALFVVRQGAGQLYVEAAIGEMAEHLSGQLLTSASGLVAACIENSLSIVADGRSPESPFSISNLERELGVRIRNAILAPMTDGDTSVGALVLADSLSGAPFEAPDLAVANYLGRRVFSWVVASSPVGGA